VTAQVVDKKALTLDGAKKVIAAAEAEAVKNHVGCSIAIGVSGSASAEQDEQFAKAGVAALK